MLSATRLDLLGVLRLRKPNAKSRRKSLEDAAADLGLEEESLLSPVCVAYTLLKTGIQAEEVSRLLSWREFEDLATALFRSSGYEVKQNLYLSKPRAQIDVVARGESIVLSVDCKHYARDPSPGLVAKFALAQVKRSEFLRRKSPTLPPIASVILSMSEPQGRFAGGAAIVPIRTLRSFLVNLDSYRGMLDMK